MKVKKNFSLKRHNTFGIDSTADTLIILNNNKDYLDLLSSDYLSISNRLILGGGSNILFLSDFKGVVIRPANEELSIIKENQDSVTVKAGAGINWDNFVAACIANGWHGLENLSDIPGLVGAAPIQNIGAYGVEVKDFIESVDVFLLNEKKLVAFSNGECKFNYRDSIFKKELKGN
ncbi:MAG: FAD-binding protein, partial [Bacteroidales bacterium]|nr:FAD-binding protein [Bacteroidales bacterium]